MYSGVVSLEDRVILLGGYTDGGQGESVKTISQYKQDSWSQIGELKLPRRGHNSILIGNEILLVGGYGV